MRKLTVPALALLAFSLVLSGCGKKPLPAPVPAPTAEAVAAFAEAAFNGDIQKVTDALKNGMPVDQKEENGNCGLMLAAFNGHVETMQVFIDAGADIHLRDSNGRTALMFASSGPFPAAVRLLIKNGSEVNAADTEERWTPIMFAAAEGLLPVVDILLEHGADPKMKDVDGDTAAAFARNRGFTALAEKLQALIDAP